MTDQQNQQEQLKAFEAYFPAHERAGNVIKEIKKDLAELNKITDTEKQYQEAELALRKHIYNEGYADSHWTNGNLWELEGIFWEETLGEYKKMIGSLREIKFKALEKLSAVQCRYCQTKNLTNPYTWNDKSFCNQACLDAYLAPCDECGNSRCGANWQRTDKDDKKRFCSKECFDKHYNSQGNNKENSKEKADIEDNNTQSFTIERERERERESKISKLKSEIHQLEQIANKTSNQEKELKNKKQELAELEKKQSQSPNKTNWTPWLIGGGLIVIIGLIGLVFYLWKKNKDKENN